MKEFAYFIKEGSVRRVSEDINLAKSLIKDMKERIKDVSVRGISPKLVFENIYDALRDFCDALLAMKGLKSYSHESSISFLKNCNFEDSIINEFDLFKYKRNRSKYYGKSIFKEDADEIRKFYERLKQKMNKIIKEN